VSSHSLYGHFTLVFVLDLCKPPREMYTDKPVFGLLLAESSLASVVAATMTNDNPPKNIITVSCEERAETNAVSCETCRFDRRPVYLQR